MPSAAHEYLQSIFEQPDPFVYLNNLPGEPEPVTENEWRDFKEYRGGAQEKDCRDAWSEALSAFANTGGGVLVWGISARRVEGIDRVHEARPLDDPDAWEGKLKSWILDATNPPVSGVEIRVAKNRIDGRGFVVCLIPESQFKPHRMEFDRRKPYLFRVGDSCVPPNPALLRSMFFPQPRKDIDLILKIQPRPERPGKHLIYIDLANVGDSSVSEAALVIETDRVNCEFESIQSNVSQNEMGNRATFVLHETLHPGMRVNVGLIRSDGRYIKVTSSLYQLDCPALAVWAVLDMYQLREDTFRLAPRPMPDGQMVERE